CANAQGVLRKKVASAAAPLASNRPEAVKAFFKAFEPLDQAFFSQVCIFTILQIFRSFLRSEQSVASSELLWAHRTFPAEGMLAHSFPAIHESTPFVLRRGRPCRSQRGSLGVTGLE